MSVVDHRASFVAHGRRGSSRLGSSRRFTSSAGSSPSSSTTMLMATPSSEKDILSISMPGSSNGAFHRHSVRYLRAGNGDDNGKKYQGLHSEAAREVNESRRRRNPSDTSTSTCGYCCISDDNLGTAVSNSNRRKSLFGGVSYGAASVKRGTRQDLDTVETAAITIDPVAGDSIRSTTSRRMSISSGEGVWLVKAHTSRRRKSSRSSVTVYVYGRKDSDEFTPDTEEAAPDTTKRAVQFSTGTNSKSAQSSHKTKTTVQFSTVSVRYHRNILGNNPFVTSGPPLELAWENEPGATESDIPIDRYETIRAPHRRSEWDLIISRGERDSRLLESGFTREEIAAAVREASRVKAQRANTVLNLKMAGVEECAENIRMRSAKMVGLRKSSEWMYNDWKKQQAAAWILVPLSNTRAKNIFQIEGSRAAAVTSPSSSGAVPSKGKRSISPGVCDLMQKIIHRGTIHLPPLAEEEQLENRKVYNGPAFGITRMSLSSRVGFGDYDECDDNQDNLLPFAVIKVVYPSSPAHDAGLRRGDRLIQLGSITALNHDHCRAIPELGQVAATKECSLPVVVKDDQGVMRDVTIWPHRWKGRGYFGFLFKELGAELNE